MKLLLVTVFLSIFSKYSFCQHAETKMALPDSTKKIELVEVACGQCKFGLPGKTCDLAVRINGKAYFVKGTHIDSHGNAHATDGFCNAIRKAEVQGELVKNFFAVTYFKLLPAPATNAKKEN